MSLTAGAIHIDAINGKLSWICCFKTEEEMLAARDFFLRATLDQSRLALKLACACNPCGQGQRPTLPGPPAEPPLPPAPPVGQDCFNQVLDYLCSPAGRNALATAAKILATAETLPAVIGSPPLAAALKAGQTALNAAAIACVNRTLAGAAASAVCGVVKSIETLEPNARAVLTFLFGPAMAVVTPAQWVLLRRCCGG